MASVHALLLALAALSLAMTATCTTAPVRVCSTTRVQPHLLHQAPKGLYKVPLAVSNTSATLNATASIVEGDLAKKLADLRVRIRGATTPKTASFNVSATANAPSAGVSLSAPRLVSFVFGRRLLETLQGV